MRISRTTVREIVAKNDEMKREIKQLEDAILQLRRGTDAVKENIEKDQRLPVQLLNKTLNEKREKYAEFTEQIMEVVR